ncbi:acyltransferase family protein [Oceanicella actignis]|uniref:Peptidoglycan/LPS O-acetylase OafA/YrhL, contains acyltransferase and SGNH-hydrolase domains n=1 Tax=Oceanicella actignis TaxID=1189325 RepID=A0A1M7THJ7_9RHOB|nr:acyltransferase family protein [Oceanicella actignis]SET58821.1 Peptidoglycan/LPS O-acetylase OafA/YrhL, contains acyltransferase and SGNH-hydrolase domains [Oceanicella actignis]SHN70190.1 Peptidoglycan/LPS O-acetylase OafA/YrhL, contains acyltransferase and SGNH-hydrolase domains [Oceanicella actignis]
MKAFAPAPEGAERAPARPPYRPDIDGLRAAAVLGVVVYHAWPALLPGGYAGVDVFFVISGFLITGIIAAEMRAGAFSLTRFYERRFRRILPALFVMLAASTAAAWALLPPRELMEFSHALRGAAVFAANIALADLTDYFAGPAEMQPLLHTWSLGVEEQFYLVFPPLLWALLRLGHGRTLAALAALAAASFAMALWGVRTAPDNAFFLPHMRMWQLLAGALLALAAPRPSSDAAALALAGAGAALIAGAFVLLGPQAGFPGWPALAPTLGAALMIAAGGRANPVSLMLGARWPVAIGLASYSLYLWHWPLLAFARTLSDGPLEGWTRALLVAAAFALAFASWRWIERPFRARPPLLSRRAAFAWAAAGSAAFFALGWAGKVADGAPWRFDPALQAVYGARQAYFEGPGRACGARTGAIARATDPAEAAALACRIGAPEGPAQFVLWGDSLAMALQPALDEAGRALGAGGLALGRSACAPLPGFLRREDAKSRECLAFNARAMQIAAAPQIRAVVIVSALQSLLAGPQGPELRARLLDTVARLRAMGKQVVIVAPPPRPGFDVPQALGRALRFGRPAPEGPARAEAEAALAPLTEAMAAARALGALTVDSTPVFCARGRCDVAREGRALFADSLHPSPEGARLMTPAIARALAHALRATPQTQDDDP